MGGSAPGLDQLIATLRGGAGSDPAAAGQVAVAATRLRRPLRIQVTGRAGTGKSTLIRALALISAEETEPVDQPGMTDPVLDGDLVIYLLSGAPQAADRRILDALSRERALVVLNKADAIGARWADAVVAAESAAHALDKPVRPVIADLAVRTRTDTPVERDMRTLRRHAAGGGPDLALSPELFLDHGAGADIDDRRQVLDRWSLYGVGCALTALRHEPTLDPPRLLQLLHAVTGVDAVHRELQARCAQLTAVRGSELIDELERIAARAVPLGGGRARDLIEDYLCGDEANRIALSSGLAHPAVRHLAAGYPTVLPADADTALARAERWRAVLSGEMPPAARRAALRVHNGYVRIWDRMSSAGF
ncbi:MAG: hypothetical protein J2P18_20310 [Nocardia sp.]|nr:hypothetical protein [Nocardia sp.]